MNKNKNWFSSKTEANMLRNIDHLKEFAANLEGKKITNEDEYHDAVNLKHRILDIDCYNWRENPCWLTKNFPKILDSDPEHIMDKLYELTKIPKNKWPKEVIFNSKEGASCEQPTQNYLPYCFQAL